MRILFFTLLACFIAFLASSVSNTSVAKEPAYIGNDQGFQAMLMPIAEEDVTEFDKPSTQAPNLVFKTQANVGDKVALKIVFTGMKLSDEMNGNVTFDIKVLAPDGSIYPGTDIKNVPALEGKVLAPQNVYNSPATLVLHFEPKDQFGPYKISATVKDNIGQHQVHLKHQVELLEGPQG